MLRPPITRLALCAALLGACESTTPETPPPPPRDAANDLGAVDASPPPPDVAVEAAVEAAVDAPRPTTFAAGPYGANVLDRADNFTVPTQDGDWSLRDSWTGEDHYIFLVYSPRAPTSPTDYTAALFDGAIADLLERSPRNVHYFFMWNANEPGFIEARDRWLGEIAAMPEADRAWWSARVHFVPTRVNMLDNWIGRMLRYRGTTALPYRRYDPIQFAIDRTQRIREVGMLGRLATGGVLADLTLLANEPIYFNWERDRDRRLARERVTEVVLARAQTAHNTIDVDATLPDTATMATFDTLEVDLNMECPNHRDGECGAWDYLSHLWVCEPAAPDPDAGVADVSDAGGPRWNCNREIARWITTYWREGRWVTDISAMLPFLAGGGRQHLRWHASGQFDPRRTEYVTTLSLRFSNRARGMRPVAAVPLWTGGAWNAMYDSLHPARRVMVPADVRRVDLYTLTTGHGGVQPTNCAEFCDHQHHFSVNGSNHTQSFPGARAPNGCADRVNEGVVPNQHGTWYFGRGGWCPGQDVAPWIVDVTRELRPGMENELRYTTTFGGRAVTANLGNIVLSSYLVYWR